MSRRRTMAAKVIATGLVGLLISIGTWSAIRARGARAAGDGGEGSRPAGFVAELPGELHLALTKRDIGAESAPTAVATMKKFRVNTVGNRVNISATAYLYDKRPGLSFFWSLRVLPARGETPVFEKHYTHQLFNLPEARELSPTFEEAIRFNLNPGEYKLKLIIYNVDSNFNMNSFNNQNTQYFIATEAQARIQIK